MRVIFSLFLALLVFAITFFAPVTVGKILFAVVMAIAVFNMVARDAS